MTSPAKRRFFFLGRPRKGVALVLVLAFVVLLASIIVAFFTRVQSEQQISRSSANQAKVKLLTDGAVDTLVGNVKQEIVAGSTASSPAPGVTIYTPQQSKNMIPEIDSDLQGKTGLENLIKVSKISGGKATNDASESRQIDLKRWNKPLFVTPASATDATPQTAFPAPQWIYVQRDGKQVAKPNANASANPNDPNTVIGRYAYMVYDEGGLLDVNVAGYPDVLAGNQSMFRKLGLSYVNLTDLKDSGGTSFFTRDEAKQLTDWRDHATGEAINSASNKDTAYAELVNSNENGFLLAKNSGVYGGQSDQKFIGRQQLIDFILNKLKSGQSLKAIPYLTTFSRDINQPSYVFDKNSPAILPANAGGNDASGYEKQINPGRDASRYPAGFLSIRAKGGYKHNDGSTARDGEPLVRDRFNLNRLAWLTWEGPSAKASAATKQALRDAGVSQAMIDAGTDSNILNYFGLEWGSLPSGGSGWIYKKHLTAGAISKLPDIAAQGAGAHDPDFFELLKASINVGSLGKARTSSATDVSGNTVNEADGTPAVPGGYSLQEVPVNQRHPIDSSVDYQIIQIGANIINQFHPDSYPRRILFDGTEFSGVSDLPYLAYIFNGVIRAQGQEADPPPPGNAVEGTSPYQFPVAVKNTSLNKQGLAYAVQVPAMWNPYDPNRDPALKKGVRPTNFRIMIDSNDPIKLAANGYKSNKRVWVATVGATSDVVGTNVNARAISYDASSNPTNTNGTLVHDAVDFSDSNGTLFREPTVILRSPGTPAGMNVQRESGPINGIKGDDPLQDGGTGLTYAPLVIGSFPLRFVYSSDRIVSAGIATLGLSGFPPASGNANRVYFTYTVQYQDSKGNWVTYDTKYGRTTNGRFSFATFRGGGNYTPSIGRPPDRFETHTWAAVTDPRTARFGFFMGAVTDRASESTTQPPLTLGWLYDSADVYNPKKGITFPIRPDYAAGFYFGNFDVNDMVSRNSKDIIIADKNFLLADTPMEDVPYPTAAAGWKRPNILSQRGNTIPCFAPGMFTQNNTSAPFYISRYMGDAKVYFYQELTNAQPSYYADADGVVRRASGAYLPSGSGPQSATSSVGQPAASTLKYNNRTKTNVAAVPYTTTTDPNFNQAQSRPLMLHRPFRSVAELGYVFRDTPWKEIDFFTPESGDAALLDIFSVGEANNEGLVAGRINLNTRQSIPLAAIIGSAYIDDPKISNSTVGAISNTVASNIAQALTARTKDATYGPFQNIAELIGKWTTPGAIKNMSYVPANSDLSGKFLDGKRSYQGFTASIAGTTSPPKDLDSVLKAASFGNPTLQTAMTQIKRFREAPIRALVGAGQTRVWNLMIDVIAETGRASTTKFTVDGEQRYWIHLAIDRLTGEVLDKQIEIVKE